MAAAGMTALRSGAAEKGPKDLREAQPIGYAKPSTSLPTSCELMVDDPAEVKILQFTDIHFYCGRDKHDERVDQRTFDDMRRMVERHDPNLIAITGDLWHDNPDGRGREFFEDSLEKIVALDKPWFFNWGNHDLLDDYADAQVRLTEAAKSLYRGAHEKGNYVVPIKNRSGETLWECLCLNTTTQGVQAEQEAWLQGLAASRKAGDRPSGAFCFLHIPLLEYEKVWQEKLAAGIYGEEVCTYGEDGSAWGPLAGAANVKACFCGHDHVNDYSGRWKEIELVYGRATGHAGYGGDEVPKGGKLITLNAEAGSYAWKSVFADGGSWVPSR